MASHGVPRAAPTLVKSEAAKYGELQDIERYKALVQRTRSLIRQGAFNHTTLTTTSELLKENPEDYTVWNYRRLVLRSLLLTDTATASAGVVSHEQVKGILITDLKFLIPLLLKFPKCYWIWNYRIWVLQQAAEFLPPSDSREFWQDELKLVSKMLSRDSRNYHGWSYRRIVTSEVEKSVLIEKGIWLQHIDRVGRSMTSEESKAASMAEANFEYTTKMIQSNLSNFSAWHARSKLIPRLLSERKAETTERRKFFNDELSLIWNALIDPFDQSLWFYHQYLMSIILTREGAESLRLQLSKMEQLDYLRIELSNIRELLQDFQDCKWIYQWLLVYTAKALDLEPERSFFNTEEMSSWLSNLKTLDPLRCGRWAELESRLLPRPKS